MKHPSGLSEEGQMLKKYLKVSNRKDSEMVSQRKAQQSNCASQHITSVRATMLRHWSSDLFLNNITPLFSSNNQTGGKAWATKQPMKWTRNSNIKEKWDWTEMMSKWSHLHDLKSDLSLHGHESVDTNVFMKMKKIQDIWRKNGNNIFPYTSVGLMSLVSTAVSCLV